MLVVQRTGPVQLSLHPVPGPSPPAPASPAVPVASWLSVLVNADPILVAGFHVAMATDADLDQLLP